MRWAAEEPRPRDRPIPSLPMMDHRTVMGFRRDDELRGRKMNRATLRRVLGYVRPYRRVLAAFIFTVVLDAIFVAIPPLLLRALLDTAIPEKNRTMVAGLALAAIGLAIA